MTVLDFYKVIDDNSTVDIYDKDNDIYYFTGKASDIPVKYLDMIIRHISASCNPNTNSIDYMLWV